MGLFSQERSACKGCPNEKKSKMSFPACINCQKSGKVGKFQDHAHRSFCRDDGIFEYHLMDIVVRRSSFNAHFLPTRR